MADLKTRTSTPTLSALIPGVNAPMPTRKLRPGERLIEVSGGGAAPPAVGPPPAALPPPEMLERQPDPVIPPSYGAGSLAPPELSMGVTPYEGPPSEPLPPMFTEADMPKGNPGWAQRMASNPLFNMGQALMSAGYNQTDPFGAINQGLQHAMQQKNMQAREQIGQSMLRKLAMSNDPATQRATLKALRGRMSGNPVR